MALEKQLAWSEHRMRELESLVDSAVSISLAPGISETYIASICLQKHTRIQ